MTVFPDEIPSHPRPPRKRVAPAQPGTPRPPRSRKTTPPPPAVLIDQREKLPYAFLGLHHGEDAGGPAPVVLAMGHLATGDYVWDGHPTGAVVERKSLDDLYLTLGKGRKRFERELERLASCACALVVVESSWPGIVAEPPWRSRMSPKSVFRSIMAWTAKLPSVRWWPAGTREFAEVVTLRWLERWWREAATAATVRGDAATPGGVGG